MDVILCHTTADFDTLGAAVGLSTLLPGSRIVLTGGMHPGVKEFLALHRDAYRLMERRSVVPQQIKALHLVDAQARSRFGKAAQWLDLPTIEGVYLYDHHVQTEALEDPAFAPLISQIEAVGATTTLMVEKLQVLSRSVNPWEATVMALGIHADTGSLTFEYTTPRDAAALAWLMAQGASMSAIGEYTEGSFSPQLQRLLPLALDRLQEETLYGLRLVWVSLPAPEFIPGLSTLAGRLVDLTDSDILILGVYYPQTLGEAVNRFVLIGRARCEGVNLRQVLEPLGGGGHPRAATATCHLDAMELDEKIATILQQTIDRIRSQIPLPPTARELMSSPVRTILPRTTIAEAQRILLRYGHSGLSVVDDRGVLVGIISRRDIDLALHHGFGHAPVKGYMTLNPKTITPDTPLPEIQRLMVTYDIGRLPVLQEEQLLGMVTRTDLLRWLHPLQDPPQTSESTHPPDNPLRSVSPWTLLASRLVPSLWEFLQTVAGAAAARGWHLYLVGGAVRDLYLSLNTAEGRSTSNTSLLLQDLDLVVDGCHPGQTCAPWTEAAGVELAQIVLEYYTKARLEVHGRFQTAALLWHQDPQLGSLWVDIATARTEFYPYPAANPEVEASSIRQDLYRRDFTINALAVRLTPPHPGELLDFFGGLLDLQGRVVRVLHSNSFIEDPTRIYRAVRFAVRLGFDLEPQTRSSIHYAIDSGVYDRTQDENPIAPALQTRLRAELQYLFEAPYWKKALYLLGHLNALRCLHRNLELTPILWQQVRLTDYCFRHLTVPPTEAALSHWLLLVEVLLLALPPQDTERVAARLQLPLDSQKRLQQFPQVEKTIVGAIEDNYGGIAMGSAIRLNPKTLTMGNYGGITMGNHGGIAPTDFGGDRPSYWVKILRSYDLATLILVAVRVAHRSLRRSLWHYLRQWRWTKPPITGHDLKQLGYKPGKIFQEILDRLLILHLDGELVRDSQEDPRAAALAFLETHYPRS